MAPPSRKQEVAAALPGTVHRIVAKTGLVESTVRRWLKVLKKDGKTHVSKRLRNVGGSTPYWEVGPGEDAPAIKPYSGAKYSRNWRKRVKKALAAAEAGEQYDRRYNRQVARVHADKTAKRGDPLINALFGRTAP